jgi:hypothetical protein
LPRRRIYLDPEEIGRLAALGCTVDEVAKAYGLAQSSMSERLSRPPLKGPWEAGQAQMKISWRRNLMRIAEEGNAAAIFLGRTVLKMCEPPRETHQEINAHVGGAVAVYTAVWGGHENFDALEASNRADVIDGEADEE